MFYILLLVLSCFGNESNKGKSAESKKSEGTGNKTEGINEQNPKNETSGQQGSSTTSDGTSVVAEVVNAEDTGKSGSLLNNNLGETGAGQGNPVVAETANKGGNKILSKEEKEKLSKALFKAVKSGKLEDVKKALADGASAIIDLKEKFNSEYRDTALISAIEKGYIEIVEELLKSGASVDIAEGVYGDTALLSAVNNHNEDIVKILLTKKPEIDKVNNAGWTALMTASNQGDVNLVKLLLDSGADVNKSNEKQKFALYHAESKYGYESDKFSEKARRYLAIIRELLLNGKIEVTDYLNKFITPLQYAGMKGYIEIVKELLVKETEVDKLEELKKETLAWAEDKLKGLSVTKNKELIANYTSFVELLKNETEATDQANDDLANDGKVTDDQASE